MKFDPVLDRVVRRIGPPPALKPERNRFKALAESILYQQLNGKAAATIVGRVVAIHGRFPGATQVLATPERRLRAAGVSRQKLGYLKDLARRVDEGSLRLDRLARLPDEEVIEQVTQVKGIGRWTAEMFLMWSLGRPDVFSAGDYGLQQAMRKLYGVRTAAGMERVAERWRPRRTLACWYLWRSLDAPAP